MKKPIATVVALAASLFALPATADLPAGAKAPLFATQGALGGKVFAFNLQAALRKGPVVVYFYPKSFTSGCTMEAHAFADAMAQFKAAGVTVIGLSADDIDTQKKFSTEHCRDAFPVGVASPAIVKSYDVALKGAGAPAGMTTRTSYVIGQDGRIKLAYSNMDFRDHVKLSLETVRGLKSAHRH